MTRVPPPGTQKPEVYIQLTEDRKKVGDEISIDKLTMAIDDYGRRYITIIGDNNKPDLMNMGDFVRLVEHAERKYKKQKNLEGFNRKKRWNELTRLRKKAVELNKITADELIQERKEKEKDFDWMKEWWVRIAHKVRSYFGERQQLYHDKLRRIEDIVNYPFLKFRATNSELSTDERKKGKEKEKRKL